MLILKSTHKEILARADDEIAGLKAIILRLESDNREMMDLLVYRRLPTRFAAPPPTPGQEAAPPVYPSLDDEESEFEEVVGMDALSAAEVESQREIERDIMKHKPTGSAPVERNI